ncbi:WhiB family transcriptional regulator [soil metagenome]
MTMTSPSPIDLEDLGSWREVSACADSPVDFFPTPEDVKGISEAKAVCATCPVADECLSFALETRQSEGIWGGHTPKERQKVRRKWAEQVRRAS